jgi:hypothetical protein
MLKFILLLKSFDWLDWIQIIHLFFIRKKFSLY